MAKHRSTALVVALAIAAVRPCPGATALAQSGDGDDDDDDSGGDEVTLPQEPVEVEAVDLTFGMRTDVPVTATVSQDGALYIGTLQGRIYRSDNHRDFDELMVLPQVKALWGFAGQTVLQGHVRSDSPVTAEPIDLAFGLGALPGRSAVNTAALHGSLENRHIVSSISAPFGGGEALKLSGNEDVRYRRIGDPGNPLAGPSNAALAGGAGAAAVGLSNRAPRLSLLQLALRRPIAKLSFGRFVGGRARRTQVGRIAVDPKNPRHIFAATRYGLYESRDRGTSFVRIFPGVTKAETDTREVIYDPHRPGTLYLGTGKGMFVSRDNGLSFSKHGFVPEVAVNKVAIDPVDPRYIYVATTSGMYRSNDGGETFGLGFYSSLRKQRTLYWVEVDKNDPERVYLGTADGIFTSGRARTESATDWQTLAGMRTLNLSMPIVKTCKGRPGLIYAQSTAALPTNIYFGNSPEGYLLVSRDAGDTWNVLASNRSQGTINWYEIAPDNCDKVWVLFTHAVIELAPRDGSGSRRRMVRDPSLPPMSQVIKAALEFQGTELDSYAERLGKLESANWLPTKLNITASLSRWRLGSVTDDFQFAEERYLAREQLSELRIMAWATWNLSGLYYQQQTIPLLRTRVQLMNDSLRKRAVATVTRHYRELVELRTRRKSGADRDRSLSDRASARVLEQQHFAVVDLATGGFLTRYAKRREK